MKDPQKGRICPKMNPQEGRGGTLDSGGWGLVRLVQGVGLSQEVWPEWGGVTKGVWPLPYMAPLWGVVNQIWAWFS